MNIKRILQGPIQFFAPDKDAGGGLAEETFEIPNDAIPGEQPPSFDSFFDGEGRKKGDGEASPEIPASEAVKPDGTQAPPKEEKPAGEAAAKKPEASSEEAKKPEAAKQTEKKEAAKPSEEADPEIDAIQISPTANTKTRDQFNNLRTIAKSARAEAAKLKAEIAEKIKQQGELPEGVKKQLAEVEELRKFRQTWELENDPSLRAEMTTQAEAADKSIFDILCDHPKLKLPKDKATKEDGTELVSAEMIKRLGVDSEQGRRMLFDLTKTIEEKLGDPVLAEEVRDAIKARVGISKAHKAKVEALRADQGKFVGERKKQEEQQKNEWGQTVEKNLMELTKEKDWAQYREPTAAATDADKAEIEAHNKRVKEEVIPAIVKAMQGIHSRDPLVSSEIVVKALERDRMFEDLKKSQEDVNRLNARIAELTKVAGGVRRISTAPGGTQSEPAKAAPVDSGGMMSATEAADAFFKRK